MIKPVYAPDPRRPDQQVKIGEIEEPKTSYSPIERLVHFAARAGIRHLAGDIESLCRLVDDFALQMKEELVSEALQGRTGWANEDDPGWTLDEMMRRAADRLEHGDPVSAANYLAFFLYHQARKALKETLAKYREEVAKQIGGVER